MIDRGVSCGVRLGVLLDWGNIWLLRSRCLPGRLLWNRGLDTLVTWLRWLLSCSKRLAMRDVGRCESVRRRPAVALYYMAILSVDGVGSLGGILEIGHALRSLHWGSWPTRCLVWRGILRPCSRWQRRRLSTILMRFRWRRRRWEYGRESLLLCTLSWVMRVCSCSCCHVTLNGWHPSLLTLRLQRPIWWRNRRATVSHLCRRHQRRSRRSWSYWRSSRHRYVGVRTVTRD